MSTTPPAPPPPPPPPGDRTPWIRVVLSDVQFWIPVIVLIAGLLVLRWIA